MSKWICVDDVIVEIGGGYIDIDTESFMSAPSIDIVHCGECKWYDGKGHCKLRYGSLGVFEDVGLDDFCSYGEREELKGSKRLVKGSEKPNNSKERSSE